MSSLRSGLRNALSAEWVAECPLRSGLRNVLSSVRIAECPLQSDCIPLLTLRSHGTRQWVLTGGTDTGIMKMVGLAMQQQAARVPVIGIGPWGAIHGRNLLSSCFNEKVNYTNRCVGRGMGRWNAHVGMGV